MELNQRLKRLEQRVAPPAERCCKVCGLPLPGAPWKDVRCVIGWHAVGDADDPPCPSCGQRAAMRIAFDRAG